VAGAVALAAVVGLGHADVSGVRDVLVDGVLAGVASAVLTGPRWERLPNHASFCLPGTSGEAVLLELERHGIVCSSGSACAAGSDEPSHVLIALGIDPVVAQTAVRFTLSDSTTLDEARETVARVVEAVASLATLR
jgi:cysteine desulfurase